MGFEVTSSGGSLGGLISSRMPCPIDLNQGVSIDAGASRWARCESGSSTGGS